MMALRPVGRTLGWNSVPLRRSTVIKGIAACLVTLLLIQFLLPLMKVVDKEMQVNHHKSTTGNQLAGNDQKLGQPAVLQESLIGKKESKQESRDATEDMVLLQKLVRMCATVLVPIIVLEPEVLQTLGSSAPPPCFPLCQARAVLTLATMDEDWTQQETGILEMLAKSNISLRIVKGDDPNLLTSPNSTRATPHKVTTHMFVWQEGAPGPLLHLVVLYARGENSFLWSGPVTAADVEEVPHLTVEQLSVGKTASAFPWFRLKSINTGQHKWFVPKDPGDFLYHLSRSTFLECNYSRALEFQTLYPSASSPESEQFTRKARQLLARTRDTLAALGVPFWLSSGTCLGWFRQCGIIPYSRDIDIGIRIADYKDGLIGAFEKNGFLLKHLFGKVSDSFELSFQAGDIKLDIFFFYEEFSYTWNGGTQASTGKKFLYKFPHFSTCRAELLGLLVWVPCPTLPYVQANYGQAWFQPVQHWDWKASPPNVQENGIWPREEWDEVIQVYEV